MLHEEHNTDLKMKNSNKLFMFRNLWFSVFQIRKFEYTEYVIRSRK